MAVTDTSTISGPFIADGVSATFPYYFDPASAAEVSAKVNGVVSVIASIDLANKRVTLAPVPPTGAIVYVLSEPSFAQDVRFENGSRWLAEPVNEVNDRGAVRDRYLLDRVSRAPQAPMNPADAQGLFPTIDGDGKWIFTASGPGSPGPSNNTRLDLAALKAAAITDKTSLYDGSLWTWTSGDFSGQADDINIVKADSTGLNLGAWVRSSPRRSDLSAVGGSSLVGFKQSGTGAINRTVQDKGREYISVADFGAKGDGVTDDTDAIMAAVAYIKTNGGTLHFPGGTYLVSTITFDGSDYAVDTSAGVVFKQMPGVVSANPAIIWIEQASNVTFGDFKVIGNIAIDSGESNHGVLLNKSKNITIGLVHGADVRGDVVYAYARNTSEAERSRGCFIRSVTGTNVFRNLLSVVGGQLHVGSVINAGPVGYRDFDVEPNDASGTYEAVDLQIDYARVGSAEITSDDPAITNYSVRIGTLDADFARVQATTPPYPSAPGAGAYALGVSRTDTVQIGHFHARNYNVWPLNLASGWSNINIGTFDVANCSLTDTIYNSMIVQQADAGAGGVHIGTLICDAANTKRLATVAGTGLLKIDVDNVKLWKGLIGNQITGRISNGTIDINGSTGIALSNSSNVIFENVTTTNHASATFSSGCTNIVGVNSSLFGSTGDGINMVVGGAVRVAGTKVLGTQQGLIGDVPTGGSATASNNATGINAILAALRAHGLIAT